MDYKFSNKRKKDTNTNDGPKMILKHKDSDLHQSVENTNALSQQIRLLSPHPNQNSNPKNYEPGYFNQVLGIEVKEKLPDIFNLIDNETWSFKENFLIKFLSVDQPNGPPAYSKIAVVGKQGVGKSSLLNKLAGKNVFKTHQSNGNELFKHVTEGIDLHITDERVFLLDSQPLMSASILDELIKSSHSNNHMPPEITEQPEKYVHITSLQILSFLIANCDYVIIMNDWLIDLHFLKLISTSLMLVGDINPKADLVFYFKKRFTSLTNSSLIQTLQSIFGKSIIIYEDDNEDGNNNRFVSNMFKLCAKKKLLYSTLNNNINVSERNWLMNAKRYWENCTSKSSLHLEYSRFIL